MTDRRDNMIRHRRQNNYHLPIAMIIATTALLLLSLSISTVSATATTNQQVQTLRGARRRVQSPTNTHSRNLKKKKGDGDEAPGLFAHKQNRIDPTTGEIIINTSNKHKKTKTHIDKEGRLVDINGNLLDKKGRQITVPERCKKPKELMKVEEKELKEQLKQAEKEAQKNKEQQNKPVVPFEEVGDIKEQREDVTTGTTTDEGLVKKTSSSVVGDKKKGSPPSSPPAPSPSTPFLQSERSIDPITGEWKPPHTSSPITQAEAEAIQLAAEIAEQAAIEAAAEGLDVFGGSLGEGSSTLEELQGTVISNSMCDEDGNLLPSYSSFSPTITPPLDEGDTDNDGLLNWQEDEYGTIKTNVDTDGDGLTDSQEIIIGTDPLKVDTDGDGVDDYTELMDGTNPLDEMEFNKQDLVDTAEGADNDGDGLFNEQEIELGTDINNADTDGDGLSDGMEVIYQQTDPLKVDTDSDGLSDYEEVMIHGTNPNNPDSDGDGYSDGCEISQNLDPLVPNDYTSDPLAISPGCESYLNDTVYVTSIPAAIDLEYEVSIDEFADIDIVNEQMERVMAKLIGETLINCGQLSSDSDQVVGDDGSVRRTRHTRSLLTSRHLLVDGIDPSPQDIILTKKTCSYYTADNADTPSNSKCYVIKSLSKLYLREDNAQSSPFHSSQQALRILLGAMNSPSPSPFLESSGDDDYSVEGVKGVRYIMGTPDEGGVLLIDNSGGSDLNNGEGIDGAQEADTNSDGDGSLDPLSPVGITLIVLGCVGILALVAGRNIRKRKDNGQKKSLQYAEFYDDENDLDMKHHGLEEDDDKFTDRDASSLHGTPSPKRSRRGDHREDDSIFSGLESPGNETTLDPAFIHTRTSNHNRDDGSQSQITAEQGYEAGGMQFYPRDPFPRSKYEPKVQVESPKYENPAGMKQPPERNGRVYHVGDTVEF